MRVLLLAGLVLLLNGCAAWRGGEVPGEASWSAHSRQVLALGQWELRGRVVARGRVAARASLRWRQAGDAFDLRVAGPFGFGAARIMGTPERIEIQTGDDVLVTTEPQNDIWLATGIWLPVTQLPYWLRGVPEPTRPVDDLVVAGGRAVHLEQDGWSLDYDDYRAYGGYWLPGRVRMASSEDTVVIEVQTWIPA